MDESLFDLIKKTTKLNKNSVVSAYKDNVAFIEGPVETGSTKSGFLPLIPPLLTRLLPPKKLGFSTNKSKSLSIIFLQN